MGIELGMGLMTLIVFGAAVLWLVDQLRFMSCPYCRKKISCGAVRCPYCRSDLDDEAGVPSVQRPAVPVRAPAEMNEMLARQMEHRRARLAAESAQQAAEIAERASRKAMRKAAREKAYRAMGIEPGPLAWFHALSDTSQAILMGLAIAVPLVFVVVMIFGAMSSGPGH